MRNILGPICIAMFVASCGGGAGTNPFDNPADSNTATTDETSNNNTGTTDNTDGSGNTETSENTVTSISFGGATPPDGNSVVNVTSENNSIIRTFGGVGDVRYAVENGNEVLYIDNLGFDGTASDPHTKVTNFGGFGTQDVYAAPFTVTDPQNSQSIPQNGSFAIAGTSTSGALGYVVVHHVFNVTDTLKGYKYQREQFDESNILVTFAPVEEGLISMTGEYLGLRTKKGTTDGEYVIAELFFEVDLQDPNDSRSTQFRMNNRTRYSMVTGQSLEGTTGYEVSLPDTIRFVVESGMDLNGEFTTEFDTDLGESTFETGAVYGILSTNADGLTSEGAGVITLTSQDPTQFMNLQNGTYDGEIDQYEEAGGFILDRNLP